MKYELIATALAAAAMAIPAGAAQISAIANPTAVVDFDNYDAFITSGSEAVAPGVTFSASTDSTLGADIAELDANGLWGAGKLFAALGSFGVDPEAGSLSFTFAAPVARVGAFVNAVFDAQALPPEIEIVALDVFDTVLESYLVSVSMMGGLNEGTFAGIGRSGNDIKTFRVSGFGLVLDDVAFASVPAPELASLMFAGLLGVIALRRRVAG